MIRQVFNLSLSKKYKNAFTLMELLIVIGIIALLAGIIYPVIQRARSKARQIECLSNLKQLGMASLVYAQDFDGYLPPFVNEWPGINCMSHRDGTAGWCEPLMLHEALTPYVKNKAVWFCPNDPYAGMDIDMWGVTHLYSSYSFNFRRSPFLSTQGWVWTHPITQDTAQWDINLHTPSGFPLIQDSHNMNPSSPSGRILPLTPGCNHFGGINICYLDGHAKWVPNPIH